MKTKRWNWGIYTPHIHWVVWGTGTPKDRDEVNRREVSECDGWVWERHGEGVSSVFKVIRSVVSLVRNLNSWRFKKYGQFPDEFVRIEVTQIHYVSSQTYFQPGMKDRVRSIVKRTYLDNNAGGRICLRTYLDNTRQDLSWRSTFLQIPTLLCTIFRSLDLLYSGTVQAKKKVWKVPKY